MKKSLFQLTWPLFIESLLFMTLGIIDTVMLSKYSDFAAGAVGATNQITGFLNLVFLVISSGGAVMLAQNIGAKKQNETHQVIVVAIITNFLFGIILSGLMILFGNSMLRGMQITADLMPFASEYLLIVGGTIFLQSLINTFSVTIRTFGYTRQTMVISLLMNIINVIGDAVFIFGLFGIPVLGVKGVALATVFSRLVALILMGSFLFTKVLPLSALKIIFKFPVNLFKQLLKIGLPSAGENISFNLTGIAMTAILFTYLGQESVIARTYISSIYLFALVFANAIGQSTQIMIGHLVGAKKYDEAYATCHRNFRAAFTLSALSGLVLILFRSQFMTLFTSDMTILSVGATALLIDGFLEPGRAFNLVYVNGLRGAGDVVFPVVLGVTMGWGFRVGVGFILGITLHMGLAGFILASLFDEWLRGFFMFLRWKSKKWVNIRIID